MVNLQIFRSYFEKLLNFYWLTNLHFHQSSFKSIFAQCLRLAPRGSIHRAWTVTHVLPLIPMPTRLDIDSNFSYWNHFFSNLLQKAPVFWLASRLSRSNLFGIFFFYSYLLSMASATACFWLYRDRWFLMVELMSDGNRYCFLFH